VVGRLPIACKPSQNQPNHNHCNTQQSKEEEEEEEISPATNQNHFTLDSSPHKPSQPMAIYDGFDLIFDNNNSAN
jgi:hypothetical protein